MSLSATKPLPNDWLERFRAEPQPALDDLLRGLARVPPYERATPSDILDRLFGVLAADDPDRQRLDSTLCDWLAGRRTCMTPDERAAYGLSRFVTETMDALSAVWLLQLPRSGAWIQDHYLELDQWAAPLRLSESWDLPRALAQAGALTQVDQRLQFYWLRLCKEAAQPSRRAMIDPALNGLSRLPDTAGQGASPQLIAGLARFGAELESNPRDQRDFLRRWRALKARFPRTGRVWQELWQGVLKNRQFQDRPFVAWLTETEAVLRTESRARPVSLPSKQQIDALFQRLQRGERESVLPYIQKMLDGCEHYAQGTGDAHFFVRSACNLGKDVLAWAPGHALVWARDALSWSPANGYAWDLRARALRSLRRPDLAQAVYWEAVRRLPTNAVVRTQLALLLIDQGREPEAEALLREAHERDPSSAHVRAELARLLARTGRETEAEALLRRTLDLCEFSRNPIVLYTFALLLVAWGRVEEAGKLRDLYVRRFGANQWSETLSGMIAAGAEGRTEALYHLAKRDLHGEPADHPIAADAKPADWAVAREEQAAAPLRRAAGASQADLLFRVNDPVSAERNLADLLADDPDDLYPQIVWALHVPERRPLLAERYREALGTLSPHLAGADQTTPAAHWELLGETFPERMGLIDLTRLLRAGADEAAAARLEYWIVGGQGDDYLRARLLAQRGRDGRIDPGNQELQALLTDAIRAEVDLGDRVLGEAA
ncbi:tetratricopeptide repeat protein [uncultured Thiodictyon sp.]|uniref:tetratricopeptide repeat protein n=1 Tax=uncultured Thiodictyon sp. TaxID=1846217 RepID=UPI0025D58F26|nr:tetratricopeptide repeat protein [uncultured Thiodictyon sp.]